MRRRHSLGGTDRLTESSRAQLMLDRALHEEVDASAEDGLQVSLDAEEVEEPHRLVELDQEIFGTSGGSTLISVAGLIRRAWAIQINPSPPTIAKRTLHPSPRITVVVSGVLHRIAPHRVAISSNAQITSPTALSTKAEETSRISCCALMIAFRMALRPSAPPST